MVVITPKMNLLQIPIVDRFYVPQSDPAALSRGTDFAAAKGFLSARRDVARPPGVHREPLVVLLPYI